MDKEKALTEARVYMTSRMPFFATVMYRMLRFQWNDQIPTACIDGRTIQVNPEFFCKMSYQQRAFVLAHETGHAIFKHCDVMKKMQGKQLCGELFQPRIMNYAQDYIINAILDDSGAATPEFALLDKEKYPGEMAVIDAYKDLLKNAKRLPMPQCGSGGEGDGQGQQFDPGKGQQQFDQHVPQEDPRSEAQWKQAIAEAAQAQKNRGTLPGSLQALVDEFLEPKVDWREELRAEITARAKGEINSWNRPNRRGRILFDAYLPSSCDFTTGTVVVGIDTSGSVSDAELQAFISEVSSILSDCKPEELWVLSVDAEVQAAEELSDPSELENFAREKLIGRGGTDMTEIMKWVEEQYLAPDFMVVLTDGYTPFGDDPGYPVIWVMSSDQEAPYGKTIQIEISD